MNGKLIDKDSTNCCLPIKVRVLNHNEMMKFVYCFQDSLEVNIWNMLRLIRMKYKQAGCVTLQEARQSILTFTDYNDKKIVDLDLANVQSDNVKRLIFSDSNYVLSLEHGEPSTKTTL